MKKALFGIIIAAMAITSGCATIANNHQPFIKEVDTRNHAAHVKFQPGPVKYVAEYEGKETILVPNPVIASWGEGFMPMGMLHSFRSARNENSDFDELTVIVKEKDLEKDVEIKVTCHFQDGSTTVKKVRVTKGEPRIIAMGDQEVVVALKPKE